MTGPIIALTILHGLLSIGAAISLLALWGSINCIPQLGLRREELTAELTRLSKVAGVYVGALVTLWFGVLLWMLASGQGPGQGP